MEIKRNIYMLLICAEFKMFHWLLKNYAGGLGSFCVGFACSPRVCVGSLRVLRLPPTIQRHACGDRLIGDSKVALGVSVCVNGCLSVCCPVMNWRPV